MKIPEHAGLFLTNTIHEKPIYVISIETIEDL